jgi:2-C-methyl-D-erythritol 4-phosphate cytidylyltransferase
LIASNPDSQLICIHDAARPFVTDSLINKTINACEKFDGSVVAIPVSDTVKYAENEVIVKTLDRENIWLAQTPQTFNKEKLLQALDNAETNPLTGTDESVLMEAMGFSIQLVEGHPNNFKITTKDDWGRAEDFAARQTQGIAL